MNVYTILAWTRKRLIKNPRFDGEYLFDDITEVTVEAETEKEALAQARKLIKRRGYRVQKVWKKDTLHEDMHMLQVEMQKKTLDILSGKK